MMTYSPVLAAVLTASVLALIITLLYPPTRVFLRRTARRTGVQVMLSVLAPALIIALLMAVPSGTHYAPDGNLWENTLATLGAGGSEVAQSLPFAGVDVNGKTLLHAGQHLKDGRTPGMDQLVKTLVAAIAGGVTSVFFMLLTGCAIAARRKIDIPAGIAALGSFTWRPALLSGCALWMLTTWLIAVWPSWHVLGTAANGADRLAGYLLYAPQLAIALIWIFLITSAVAWRRSFAK